MPIIQEEINKLRKKQAELIRLLDKKEISKYQYNTEYKNIKKKLDLNNKLLLKTKEDVKKESRMIQSTL